ncbi:MAG: cyclic nucleotide-binding/CBS domain-containing protein [Nitrososphaeraceae archaeon]
MPDNETFEKVFVYQIMSDNIVTANMNTTALDISKLMIKKNISSVVITDSKTNKIIGIVTERDLIRNVCVPNILASSVTAAGKLMSSPLLTISKETTIKEATKFMLEKRIRHIAISDGEEILGIITTRDLINDMRSKIKPEMNLDYNILDMMNMTDIPLEEGGFSLPLAEDELK